MAEVATFSARSGLGFCGTSSSGFASRALDPIATAKVEKPIYQLRENYTVVIVTHNMPSERQTEDYITSRFG
jgi:hypothetical protein